MAIRVQNVIVRLLEGDTIIVYMDSSMVDKVKSIGGVEKVMSAGTSYSKYYVELDPRYKRKDVIKEIEALNNQIGA